MRNNKGLTLVELLITLTILALVMTLTATILVQAFNIFNSSTGRVSNNRLTQIMVEDITQNIREYSYFNFKSNNIWKFASDRVDNFIIKYDKNKNELTLNKSDKVFRKLEGVKDFKLKSYASDKIVNYDKNKIEFRTGIKINFDDDKIKFNDDIKIKYIDSGGNKQDETFTGKPEIKLIQDNKIKVNNILEIQKDDVIKITVDGTDIDLNNSVFEFEIEVDTGNNIIKEVRTVYSRNFNFWR